MLALTSPRVWWLSVLNPQHSANALYQSSDGGQHWTPLKMVAPGLSIATVVVESSSQAILEGPSAHMWITQDGGPRWVRRSLPSPTALPLSQVLLSASHGTSLYLALRGSVADGEEAGTVYETSSVLRASWTAQTNIPDLGIKSGIGLWAGRLWVTGLSMGNGQEILDSTAWPPQPSVHWSAAVYALPESMVHNRAQTELQSFPPSAGWLPVTANNRIFFDRWQDGQWTHPVMAPIHVVPDSTPVWAARGSRLWIASGRALWRWAPHHLQGIRSTPIQAGAIVALSFITARDGAMVSQRGAQVTIWRTNDGGNIWRIAHRFIGQSDHHQAISL